MVSQHQRIPVLFFAFALLCASLTLTLPVSAQLNSSGTISGRVQDSTGASLPGANIVVLNQGTHLKQTTTSSSDGTYVLPGLQPGQYTVTVTLENFAGKDITGIQVHPTQVVDVPVSLSIGTVDSQVTVSATSAQVETSTPEISSQLSEDQVQTLPMNGRNFQTLAALMPGAVNTQPDTQMGQGGFSTNNVLSANGAGTSGTFYTVDGIWNENTGNFTQTSVTPPPDTIQEVRLLQNNYSAQYNFTGATVVVVQSKSGTSEFHGGAYEFFRNDVLNARNYFSTTVPTLKQNIYGFILGGPVFVPHLYPRAKSQTFFFWGEQWSPSHHGSVIRGATATADERTGNFGSIATPITDPTTHQPFPNNIIPPNRLVPQAVTLINASAPLPNNVAAGFDNYLNQDPLINSQRNDFIKIDHNFSQKYRLSAEYIGEHANTVYANNPALGAFNSNKQHVSWPDYLTQLQFTSSLTSHMVNVASIAMNHRVVSLTMQGVSELSQVQGYTQSVPYTGGVGSDRLPEITFTGGYSNFGTAPFLPLINNSNLDLTISDDWNWLKGAHYLQVGFNYYYGLKRQTTSAASNGVWNFTGQFTGNPLADYLLGYAASLQQTSSENRPYLFYPFFSPYVQDTWKVTKRLTLSGGVRYFWQPVSNTTRGTMTVFNPADYVAANAPIVNTNGTIVPTPTYNPTNGLVLNGENGVPLNYANRHNSYLGPDLGFAWDVRGDGRTSLRGGYGIAITRVATAYNCAQPCSSNPPFQKSITLVNPNFPNAVGAAQKPAGAPAISSEVPDLQSAQIQSYSLSLQQQLGSNWIFSVAGAGALGRHLGMNLNFNQPLPYGQYDFNPVINTGKTFTYLYGPYQGYAAITTSTSKGISSWHALELTVGHAMSHGFYMSASYTWQHGLTNVSGATLISGGAAQDAYNLRHNYGNSSYNVPQVFASSVIWSLPWLKDAAGLKRSLLSGWQVSDITTLQSGFSLDPGLTSATQGLATRPDATGQSISGSKTVATWFNTSAFTQPAAGHFGNATPGEISGPGTINFDIAMYKDFSLRERQKIQFRAELFNAFNHTNFSSVSTALGSGQYGQVTAARDPRIAEFALRYAF